MAKTRALVKRRKAVRNIRKITRTMELIATARFKKAMDRAVEADSYTRRIGKLVADLGASASDIGHPLLEPRETVSNAALLVLTSNRGLCGGYNANVLRLAVKALRERQAVSPVEVDVSGKRGIGNFRYRQIDVRHAYTHFEDKPAFDEVEVLAQRYLSRYQDGAIDRLDVVYTQFFTMGRQEATVRTLLPMTEIPGADLADVATEATPAGAGGKLRQSNYEFRPSATDILNEIVPVSFKVQLFKCFLDAAVSEQIARMVAMKGATENAGNLIKEISLKYNRARQAQITSELSEIIGTAEALN